MMPQVKLQLFDPSKIQAVNAETGNEVYSMLVLRAKFTSNVPSAAELYKQIQFGTALGLTRTAKAAQAASVDAIIPEPA